MFVCDTVRSFGTESRTTANHIPPSEKTFDFVCFRGQDIKDLHVHDAETEVGGDSSQHFRENRYNFLRDVFLLLLLEINLNQRIFVKILVSAVLACLGLGGTVRRGYATCEGLCEQSFIMSMSALVVSLLWPALRFINVVSGA